ncbi:hypothetical protein SAMN04488540_105197 [Ferrimonas sediminum]|uniref:Uncharacterized protein n=1 Tax=Ferrimonas sediminum TaxID=718193 RepID=A0A1G8RJT9_9GAMM|nr:hypothetical protein SAMN04488540_105197 [Ferrimonas sediminum]
MRSKARVMTLTVDGFPASTFPFYRFELLFSETRS